MDRRLGPVGAALELARLVHGAGQEASAVAAAQAARLAEMARHAQEHVALYQRHLARAGRASLSTYPSSAVRLASAATSAGVSLAGLVVRMVGEPVTATKAARVFGFRQRADDRNRSMCPAVAVPTTQ